MDNGFVNPEQERKARWNWLLAEVINVAFLLAWLFLQWVVDYVGSLIPQSPQTKLTFTIFQVVFGITSIVPILAYIIVDTKGIIDSVIDRLKSKSK